MAKRKVAIYCVAFWKEGFRILATAIVDYATPPRERGFLLLEDGFFVLLEDGGKIKL